MRQPTPSEWTDLSGAFPKLQRQNVSVTDEATQVYNCIAWSMGYTDRWINPLSPLAAFEGQYHAEGFPVTGAPTALIDGWGISPQDMTHGSRKSTEVAGLWSSKLGSSLRITHGRDELAGNMYGTILTHFGAKSITEPAGTEHTEASMGAMLNPEESRAIEAQVAEVDPALRDEFEQRFSAWKTTFRDHLVSSDTRDYATGPEFEALASLGRPALPLIMQHLADEDGFFLLPLLDALPGQATAQLSHPLDGEQSRAARTLRQWLSETGN
jgi:hypothetical protein